MVSTITFEKYKIAYKHIKVQSRSDTALVFLHQGLGSIEQWKNFPEKLVSLVQLPAIIYDRPGYGNSYPKKLNYSANYMQEEAFLVLPKFLSFFNYKKFILYGHSDGATIALLYATKFVENTWTVICEAPHVIVEKETLDGIKTANTNKEKLVRALKKYHNQNAEELYNRWQKVWLNESFKKWTIQNEIKKINAPMLIIQGINDDFGTMKQLEIIKQNVKSKVKLVKIRDCGHSPHLEHSSLVSQNVWNFIEEISK